MAMTAGFKVFHILLLMLVCQCYAKVDTKQKVNGFFDDYDRGEYDRSFGSGGVGVLSGKIGTTLILDMINPPKLAPIGSKVPINAGDEGSVFGMGKTKNTEGEVESKDLEVNLKNVGRIDVSDNGINNRKIKDGIVSTFKRW
ncbi:keratin, type I cytoskeletal 9-like [Cucumis melo var. makuwa]|uniref:Keratin, type I cytoskeletal 9-like n=1 Tax=Cucumis melo var. makuwa TaxID=1194695 RepID=A0A5A7VQT6_CUCMM|nr:keratin, type I cytoskeletal 9-like [Cucumis melo var. makuwa]